MRFSLSVTLCFSAVLLSASWSAGADRILRFPEQSVGTLSIRPTSLGGFGYSVFGQSIYEGWSTLGPAAGEAVIPNDHFVRLELSHEGATDLIWVNQLPINAIDALMAYGTPIDDAGIHQLLWLTNLKSLEIGRTEITSQAATSLAQLSKLQYLGVGHTQMDNDAMVSLATLSRLEAVGLYGTKITDTGLAFLAKSRSLKAIYVGGTKITDAGVAELCKLRDLRALNLYAGNPEHRDDALNPSISDAVVDSLSNQTNLEHLDLTGANITDIGLEQLASKLPNLRRLVLDHTQVTAEGMRYLSSFTALESLRFYGLSFDDEAAQHIASLRKLRKLTGDIKISDAGVKSFSTLSNLESLSLNGHLVTDDSIPALTNMLALKDLSLQHTHITDEGFAGLAELKSIESIQLTGNRITTRCIETLALIPKLNRVGLMDIDPRVDGEPVWKGLEGLSSLESELWLCFCPSLSPKDFEKLSLFSKLKQLRIEGGFQPDGGRPVTNADLSRLAGLNQLEFLELSSTVITDEGLEPLTSLPRLQRLSISCLATDAGLEKIAQAPALERLTIASPAITDAAIDRAQAENPHLQSIYRQPFRLSGSKVSRSASDSFWRKGRTDKREKLNEIEGKVAPGIAVTEWLNLPQDSTLKDFRGKVVLIDFWGIWCGPCVAKLPEMRRLHEKYADQGLVVIGVHSSKEASEAAGYVKYNNLTWPIALDDENFSRDAYHVKKWPSCYLIDRQGVLRMANIFDGDREAAIQALLSEDES